MPARNSMPLPLTLVKPDEQQPFKQSPLSPKSPKTPRSPFRFTSSKKSPTESVQSSASSQLRTNSQTTDRTPAIPPQPEASREGRSSRADFFSNKKASKSSSRLQPTKTTAGDGENMKSSEREKAANTGRSVNIGNESSNKTAKVDLTSASSSRQEPLASSFNTPLSSTSISTQGKQPDQDRTHIRSASPMKAPVHDQERSLRSMMSSAVRQNSSDRVPNTRRDRSTSKNGRHNEHGKDEVHVSNAKQAAPQTHKFLNNLKNSASKGAGAISKGLFGKSRSDSTHEKDVSDLEYVLRILNKPLVEQTRLTRISKRLEESRDKTEFWMPAFPWRAIDYLNYKGSEMEGLYRVPGSTAEVKAWQRRFDEKLDIDLFDRDDLYDINIIGSMLKTWFRDLPDELFPKATQDRITKTCSPQGTDKVPQLLVDELSNLPPFNYYLLFAITCHLSLLLAHEDSNKMSYKNICICFQPCIRIDPFCFKFLVCDWRDCWKGCKTESYYVEQEYALLDPLVPSSADGRSLETTLESPSEGDAEAELRNLSSSDSSKPSMTNEPPRKPQFGPNSHDGSRTITTTVTVDRTRTPPGNMRPLSPIKPLSPIGL